MKLKMMLASIGLVLSGTTLMANEVKFATCVAYAEAQQSFLQRVMPKGDILSEYRKEMKREVERRKEEYEKTPPKRGRLKLPFNYIDAYTKVSNEILPIGEKIVEVEILEEWHLFVNQMIDIYDGQRPSNFALLRKVAAHQRKICRAQFGIPGVLRTAEVNRYLRGLDTMNQCIEYSIAQGYQWSCKTKHWYFEFIGEAGKMRAR